MDVERFRSALRHLRKTRVGTQSDLAALTKRSEDDTPVSPMTISSIETGAIADPGIVTVSRIVEAMPGVTLSSFFARVEDMRDGAPSDLSPPNPDKDIDEAIAALSPAEVRAAFSALGKAFNTLADRGETERRTNRGYAPTPRDPTPDEGTGARGRRPRAAPQRVKRPRK